MSTIMTDPVKLPSGYILDRSTIARHLLRLVPDQLIRCDNQVSNDKFSLIDSDQNDPFTRAALSMEMVVPDTELKNKIDLFIEEYNQKRNQEH